MNNSQSQAALFPTLDGWHIQFRRQARWTQATRNQLYRRANVRQAQRVLDVGCGTGVLCQELARRTSGEIWGIDLDSARIEFARRESSGVHYEIGDAQDLPYDEDDFDLVLCHFFLLWAGDPGRAVREMVRVLRPGGRVLICAEPDYGGRIDWPDLPLREWQIAGLREQGADPCIGRRLRELLVEAGLSADVGVMPSLWRVQDVDAEFEQEWTWLAYDVGGTVDETTFTQAKEQARQAVQAGTRMIYMPVFYGMGKA